MNQTPQFSERQRSRSKSRGKDNNYHLDVSPYTHSYAADRSNRISSQNEKRNISQSK